MTLLVLPLVEPVPKLDARGVGGMVADNSGAFLAFGVSFLVIYQFWAAHDRLFASCPTSDVRGLPTLQALRLLAVAFLPFPTAIVGQAHTSGP